MEPAQLVYPFVLWIGGEEWKLAVKRTTANPAAMPVMDGTPVWDTVPPVGGTMLSVGVQPDGLVAGVRAMPETTPGHHYVTVRVMSGGQVSTATREFDVRAGGQVVAVELVDVQE